MDRDGMLLEGSGESSSSGSDTDMEAVAAIGQTASSRIQPVIDEDGFQLVQGRKPGRGR